MDDSALHEAAAAVMPDAGDTSMMDNMDDLFGDAADGLGMGVGVVLPSAPLPASLIYRVTDTQRTGCCTKLAWSNNGSIAQISNDGSKVTFRTVLRDLETGAHDLSEESRHPIEALAGKRFAHLQFNGPGVDLAVVDCQGGVRLYTIAGAIGRMQPVPGDTVINNGERSDLDAVVGLHWLPLYPTEFRTPYITPATKSGVKWTTQMRHPDQHSSRPHHPAEHRGALLYVTANCNLVLLYQNEQGAWQYVSTELESWISSEALLSHAAIGDDGDHLILATHDEARRFRLYRITIHWNSSQQSKGSTHYTIVAPTVGVTHLTALEHVAPQHSDLARLSHLRILSKPPDFAQQGPPSTTTVLAIFTHASVSINASQPQQDAFSVVARWNIDSLAPTLHDSFTKLKSNGPTPVQSTVTILRRQPDIISGKLILTVDTQYHNTLLALGASDGTIEFRDRSTMSVVEGFGDTTTTSSLPQTGFGYFPGDQVAWLAANSDGSAMVISKADDSLETKTVTLISGWQLMDDGISDNQSLLETAVVCLARQYAILCSTNASSDEALGLLPPDLSPEMRVFFVQQVIRTMCKYIDVSMLDHQKQQRAVLQEPLLTRAMSAQLVLGTTPGSTERTFAGQFAYSVLNFKLISMALIQSISRESAIASRSDLVPSLAALIKWGIDFVLFIVESLAQLKRGLKPGMSAKQAAEQFAASTGNPSVHLLLCSFARVLLRGQIMSFPQYLKMVQAALPRARSMEERQQLQWIWDIARSLPLSFNSLMEFIVEVDSAVRNAYTEAGVGGDRRMEIEMTMMTEGLVPDELQPALQTLLDKILPKICESADMGELYFWDTQWLGIEQAVPAAGAKRYDAIRKRPLADGMKLRVCRRCGAQMEDLPPEQVRQLPTWLQHGQKQCYCQNYWWLE